jgi:RNA polymerase sigma factor (sigma-70 family)
VNSDQFEQVDFRAILSEQVRQSGRLLFRVAYGLLRDAAGAEDVCQQTFMNAWEHRGQIRSPAALRSWLATTVTNRSLEVLRRRRTEQRVLRLDLASRSDIEGLRVHEGELRDAILDGLAKLPEQTRLIVVLRVMRGLSGGEVKDLIGCSASEVSRQLHRGLEQLRHLLPELETEING